MHVVSIIALNGVVPFDLSVPCETFGRALSSDSKKLYDVRVCGEIRTVRSRYFRLQVPFGLNELKHADTVIVPRVEDITVPISADVIRAIQRAARRGARIASICSGAFVLAAAGLLDGRRATTHWAAAPALAKRYPRIKVDPNVLFVDNGQVLTSAGAAAGLDLCLHLVGVDFGATVAAEAARVAVMPLAREGGQAQFIVHEPPRSGDTLQPLLRWMESRLHHTLSLEQLAERAGMSTRTLGRRFREQTGTTPLQWVISARIRRAQQMLETTQLTVERISTEVGFETAAAFRDRFTRLIGTNPSRYRQAFDPSKVGLRDASLQKKPYG